MTKTVFLPTSLCLDKGMMIPKSSHSDFRAITNSVGHCIYYHIKGLTIRNPILYQVEYTNKLQLYGLWASLYTQN